MSGRSLTFLFAERDPDAGRHLRMHLRRRGGTVVQAPSVRELLGRVESLLPDLVVLDDNFDGLEFGTLITLIRKHAPQARIALRFNSPRPMAMMEEYRRALNLAYCGIKSEKDEDLLKVIGALFRTGMTGEPAPQRPAPLILCVDDERFFLKALSRILSRHGYRVAAYEDPARALDAISEISPDMAILDVRMPDISGLDLAREILRGSGRRIPIVILSAADSNDDISIGYDRGATYYLTKPCEPQAVLNIVDYLVGDLDDAERSLLETQL